MAHLSQSTICLVVLWCVSHLLPQAACAEVVARPNIVMILADDLGYGDLGCYGRADIQTPHIDALAKSGVRFTAYYAAGPECTPTRAALLTGRYPQRIGGLECAIGIGSVGRYDDAIRLAKTNDLGLPASEQTIVSLLGNAGYVTAITGKWHLGYQTKCSPLAHGFDYAFYLLGGGADYFYHEERSDWHALYKNGKPIERDGQYFTDLVTEEAVGFLERQDGEDRPFFLYVAYTAPHAPFQNPSNRHPEPLPDDSPLWRQGHAPPEVYIAMIERMDSGVGDILQALDTARFTQETLVIFASDNGGTGSARNTPYSRGKGSTFEGGIRVPALARWPGVIPAGVVSNQPCITMDLTASIAAAAGVRPDPQKPFDGIDLLGRIAVKQPVIPRTLYWRKQRGERVWMAVRDGSLKYVATRRGQRPPQEFLFDLRDDPGEQSNLKQANPKQFQRLQTKYQRWERNVRTGRRGGPGWQPD